MKKEIHAYLEEYGPLLIFFPLLTPLLLVIGIYIWIGGKLYSKIFPN